MDFPKLIDIRYCIGAVDRESAWRLAFFRGMLASSLVRSDQPKGSMLAVGASDAAVRPEVDLVNRTLGFEALTVACINSPSSVTVSGDAAQIDRLNALLTDRSVFARKLRVDVAYHSRQMDAISREYVEKIGHLQQREGKASNVQMVSSVSGTLVSPCELQSVSYWARNLVSPVKFFGAVNFVCASRQKANRKKLDGSHRHNIQLNSFLELGPHAVLQGPIRDILESQAGSNMMTYNSVIFRHRSSIMTLMEAMGSLHQIGFSVDLARVNTPGAQHPLKTLVDLPEYPFNHSKLYWHESRVSRAYRLDLPPRLDLLGKRLADSNPLHARWRHFLKVEEMPWLEDHKVRRIDRACAECSRS